MKAKQFTLPVHRETSLSRDQILDAYIDLFRQAVARCVRAAPPGPVSMGLSGGRDSRHILLELCHQNAAPDMCWTIDLPNAPEELIVARRLAQSLGVHHQTVAPTLSIQAEQEKNKLIQYSSMQHGWIMGSRPVISRYSTVYDGIGGDMLSAGLYLSQRAVELVAARRIDEYIDSIVPDVTCLDPVLFPRNDAVERLHSEFINYLNRPDPISAFWFASRTRRDIATSAFLIVGDGKKVMTPFLDDDLVAFFLSLPMRMTVDHRLHSDTIERAFPGQAPYSGKTKMPRSVVRRTALAGLSFCALHDTGVLQRWPSVARLLGTAVRPQIAADYLTRMAVYCHGISDSNN
jgi:asparagine synthetase B (glutamine-hydrolysing)